MTWPFADACVSILSTYGSTCKFLGFIAAVPVRSPSCSKIVDQLTVAHLVCRQLVCRPWNRPIVAMHSQSQCADHLLFNCRSGHLFSSSRLTLCAYQLNNTMDKLIVFKKLSAGVNMRKIGLNYYGARKSDLHMDYRSIDHGLPHDNGTRPDLSCSSFYF